MLLLEPVPLLGHAASVWVGIPEEWIVRASELVKEDELDAGSVVGNLGMKTDEEGLEPAHRWLIASDEVCFGEDPG